MARPLARRAPANETSPATGSRPARRLRPVPGRRARDRLSDRDGTQNPALTVRHELQNVLLLVDDDLRETAQAMESIEGFLVDALHQLEREDLRREDLLRLAADEKVLGEMDRLGETLMNLKRRLMGIAGTLR
jgi:hypothetical protein